MIHDGYTVLDYIYFTICILTLVLITFSILKNPLRKKLHIVKYKMKKRK